MKKYIAGLSLAFFCVTAFAGSSVEQIKQDVANTFTANLPDIITQYDIDIMRNGIDAYLITKMEDGSITSYVFLPLLFYPDTISETDGLTIRIAIKLPNANDFSYIEIIARPIDNKRNSRRVP